MMQGMQPPRRMRFSWESRCRFARQVKEQGLTPEQAAVACGAHRSTGYRWLARFEEAGWDGLVDRSSVPRRQPRRLSLEAEREILAVRQRTLSGARVVAFDRDPAPRGAFSSGQSGCASRRGSFPP